MAGSKPPAFQFYAKDFLVGTSEMTFEEVGLYIRLLAHSWDRGPLPLEAIRMARMVGVGPEEFARLWETVQDKWKKSPRGYVNPRMELQRSARKKFVKQQAFKGRVGAKLRWAGHTPAIAADKTPAIVRLQPEYSSAVSDLRSASADQDHSQSGSRMIGDRDSSEGGEREERAPATLQGPVFVRRDPGLIHGPSQRSHGQHAWCGRRCVPFALHEEFKGQSLWSDAELKSWYASTLAKFENQPIGDDLFRFWKNELAAAIGTVTSAPADTKSGRTMAAAKRVMAEIRRGAL